MKLLRVFTAVVLVLVGSALEAATITATTDQSAAEASSLFVRAQRLDGAGEPIVQSILVPGISEISLPNGLWELRLTDRRFWMPPLHLRDTDSASARVFPTVALRGTSNDVKELRVQFTSDDAANPSGEADCDMEDGSWTCRIVAGRYNLRFSSPRFAPEFRFGVNIRAEGNDDLRLRFVPGASLSGRVDARPRSKIRVDAVEVFLFPASADNSRAKLTATTDQKGFFQFKGLPPGDYRLRAGNNGLVSRSESIKILAGAAAELNAPLHLDVPKRLTVSVMPRLDPSGRPWKVRLFSNDRRLRRSDIVSESPVSESGEWTHRGLVAGDYTVSVFTANGERWKSEDVNIDADDLTLAVIALAERVRGVVTLGTRPLQASLSFGGEGGPRLTSDELGRFEGDITPDDREERTVLVEAETPRVKRTVAARVAKTQAGESHLSISLPATTLLGRVINDDGSPEPRAWITISGGNPETFQQTSIEPDGGFQMRGYEPGTYKVTADADGRMSKALNVELRDDQTSEVELVLLSAEHVQGRATIGDAPAIAADVYAFPRDSWTPVVPQAVSNESGFFQLDLPPRTNLFDFVAVHPAFDILFGRTTLVKDKQFRIHLFQMGGTVTVESSRDDRVLLLRNGAEMPADWLANKAGGTAVPGRITIPRLVPSQYSACTLNRKTCVSGYLPPHGTLTLTLAAD